MNGGGGFPRIGADLDLLAECQELGRSLENGEQKRVPASFIIHWDKATSAPDGRQGPADDVDPPGLPADAAQPGNDRQAGGLARSGGGSGSPAWKARCRSSPAVPA